MAAHVPKVLFVDDDADVVSVVSMMLERSGFAVETASYVEDVAEMIADSLPDVVVCDYQLPDGTGVDVVRAVCGKSGGEDVPFVLLSGMWLGDDALSGVEDSIRVRMTKPFSPRELIDAVARLFAATGIGAAA